VVQITQDIQSGHLPPDPLAHVHLIGIYKILHKYEEGYEFWKWLSTRDDTYVDQAVYGAAIELLAYQGQVTLEKLEELYAQGLQRFPGTYAAYHLSPGAIVPDRSKPILISGLPMVLFQGILTARILKRDWKGSYLALDTALRLYPTQVPRRFFELFILERPTLEGFTVFLLACRAGVILKPHSLTQLLVHLTQTMDNCNSMQGRITVLSGMVTAIHAHIGGGGSLDEAHFGALICAFGHLLPNKSCSKDEESSEARMRKAVALAAEDVSRDLFQTGKLQSGSIFNVLMSVACRIHVPDLFSRIVHELERVLINPDNIIRRDSTRLNILVSASHFKKKDLIEHYWNEHVSLVEAAGRQLSLKDWLTLARAARRADHEDYFMEQCRRLSHTLTEPMRLRALHALREDEGIPEVMDNLRYMDHSAFENQLEGLRKQIQQVVNLLRQNQLLNFYEHPLPMFLDHSRRTLGSEGDLRAIYNEFTVDPHQPPQHNPNESSLKSTVSPTGIPVDELRFQNWCTVTELMKEAAVAEQELGRRINEAIATDSPFHISPSVWGFELSHALPNSTSGNGSKMTYSNRDEVREKILRLRSPSPAWSS
jgi:hypothetical protein